MLILEGTDPPKGNAQTALGLEAFYIDFFSLRYMNLARVHHLFYSVKSILK